MLTPQVPPTTSSLQASPKALCANQRRPHRNPGLGLGLTRVTAHKHIPLLCFQIPLTDNRLSLGCAHRTPLGLGSACRLLLHLLGLFPGSAHGPSPGPVTLSPAHAPGSSLSPRLFLGSSHGPPRVPGCAHRLAPPFSLSRKSRPAVGLWPARPANSRFGALLPTARKVGGSVPASQRFLSSFYWAPRARPLEAARAARARRICRDESAGVAPAASRECGTDGGGATGLAG